MYKNNLMITFDKDLLVDLQKDISWQDKDIMFSLMNSYIPESVRLIIPYNTHYEITWTDVDEFNKLLKDETYIEVIDVLKKYSVTLDWKDISATQDF